MFTMIGAAATTMPRMALGAGDTICSSVPDCSVAIGEALTIGFRHVDTAYEYGTQAAVGKALRASGLPRHEYFITTKIPGHWLHAGDVGGYRAAPTKQRRHRLRILRV